MPPGMTSFVACEMVNLQEAATTFVGLMTPLGTMNGNVNVIGSFVDGLEVTSVT